MPDNQPEIGDLDFDGEMQHLVEEAESRTGSASAPSPRTERKDVLTALGQMVRPLAAELEHIKRATADNGVLLTILNKVAQAQRTEPDGYERINQQLQRLGSVESANQKLFDALHSELKGYKDSFLFDALQRPFVRDLVAIFDDFTAVHAQIAQRLAFFEAANDDMDDGGAKQSRPIDPAAAGATAETENDFLRMLAGNVENQVHHFLEVFLRMEVVLSQSVRGTPLDKKTHRTVGFEPTRNPAEDGQIVRSLKPGFTWRERMIRPEEVVVYRLQTDSPGAARAAEEKIPVAANANVLTDQPTHDLENIPAMYTPEPS